MIDLRDEEGRPSWDDTGLVRRHLKNEALLLKPQRRSASDKRVPF